MTNQSKPYETLSQAQKALKIFMVPKFTSAAYFAATEKGAKQAVAELKGEGMAIDFLYTGPSVANTDEEIRVIDDLVAQKPDAIIIAANHADAMVPVEEAYELYGCLPSSKRLSILNGADHRLSDPSLMTRAVTEAIDWLCQYVPRQ